MMNIKFDSSALGNAALTDSNVYITFAAAASDMIYDPNETKETINFVANNITIDGTEYGTSKAYSLADVSSKGIQLNSATSLIGFIPYGDKKGIEKLGVGSQPAFLDASTPRYSIFEISYNGTTGGADITNISQFVGSIDMEFQKSDGTVQSRIGNILDTTKMFTALGKSSDYSGSGSKAVIFLDADGKFLRAVGTNVFPNGTVQTPFDKFNAYLQSLFTANGANSVVKELTNLAPGANPGGQCSAGFPSSTSATNVTPSTSTDSVIYNLDYHFTAHVTQVTELGTDAPNGTYSVKLKGYVNATAANSGTAIQSYKYENLDIEIAADDLTNNNLYMTNFIYQAALQGAGISVSKSGWEDFITDFGSANVEAAAIKKVAGDFAEGMTCGFPGSTVSADSDSSKTLGEMTSYEWWQNPQLAYSIAQPPEFYYSRYGNAVFMNSDGNNAGTKFSYGGVYGSPYDDRFGLNLISPDANTTDMVIKLLADGDLTPGASE